MVWLFVWMVMGFNPLPTNKAGRILPPYIIHNIDGFVSIHSRPIKPGEYYLTLTVSVDYVVSIHSRPIKPGE